ncbi:MAG: hypothetical protein PHW79_00345 [Candidatus Marinimicrobia bacterium]|nr:hypothetical protein [Candidatus Neomarinimicrobiota bacterium]
MSVTQKTANRILRRASLYDLTGEKPKRDKKYLLICLPFDPDEFQIAQRMLFSFIIENALFIKVCVYQSFFPILKNIDLSLFFPILNSDLDESRLPFGHLTQDVFQYEYAAAVDLSSDPSPTNAYLVYNCGATMRIGFHTPATASIFNLSIKKSEDVIEPSYQRIKSLLTDQIRILTREAR